MNVNVTKSNGVETDSIYPQIDNRSKSRYEEVNRAGDRDCQRLFILGLTTRQTPFISETGIINSHSSGTLP